MDYYYNMLKSAQKNAMKSDQKVKEIRSLTDSRKSKNRNDQVDPEAVRRFLEKSKEKEASFQEAMKAKMKTIEQKRKQERIEALKKKGIIKDAQPPAPIPQPQPPQAQSSQPAKGPALVSKSQPNPPVRSVGYTFEDMLNMAKKNVGRPGPPPLPAPLPVLPGIVMPKKRPAEDPKKATTSSSQDGPTPVKRKKMAGEVSSLPKAALASAKPPSKVSTKLPTKLDRPSAPPPMQSAKPCVPKSGVKKIAMPCLNQTGIAAQFGIAAQQSVSAAKPTASAPLRPPAKSVSAQKQVPLKKAVPTITEKPPINGKPGPVQSDKSSLVPRGTSAQPPVKMAPPVKSIPVAPSKSIPGPPRSQSVPQLTGIAAQLGAVRLPKRDRHDSDSELSEEDEEYEDDFIDDSEVPAPTGEDYARIVKAIHKTIKFDPTKYADVKPWDDCRNMEASFKEIEKEERQSARLGRQEDLIDMKEELMRKMKKKKG